MLKSLIRTVLLSLFISSLCWFGLVQSANALSSNSTIASLFSFSGTPPTNLGLNHDRFADCPSTPNCVSSFSTDAEHKIEPIRVSNPDKAFAELKQAIEALPRTKIVQASDRYLYAEFTSKIMGFVDDVEFYLDKPTNVIQVRSASRLGESDLGVNRQRIESIRAQLTAID